MDWRQRLGLEAHPEGGWYRRIYTATGEVDTPHGRRALASSIHYLLDAEQPQGRFHRVRSTILHFLQAGGPVRYGLLDGAGKLEEVVLGFGAGERIALEVHGGVWKASRLVGNAEYALVSEVVVPGFDWHDHDYLAIESLPTATREALHRAGWQTS